MIHKRIGNDLQIEWRVERLGQPENFTGKAIALYLQNRYERIQIVDYLIDGNVLKFIYPGKIQKHTGEYGLLLTENSGTDGMYTVSLAGAFCLSFDCCCDCNKIELRSDISLPANGYSAYEIAVLHGFTGSEEDWLAYIRQPSEDAAEAAMNAAAKAETATEEMQELYDLSLTAENERQKAELGRISAEAARQGAEQGRDASEQTRQSAEAERKKAESLRAESEKERSAAETERNASEKLRQQNTATAIGNANSATQAAETATEEMQELYDLSLTAENERQKAESDREEAENARETAEADRVQAEKLRQSNSETAISNAETATKNANDAASIASENVLAIVFDQETGSLDALVGSDGSAFDKGYIEADGSVILEFNYD